MAEKRRMTTDPDIKPCRHMEKWVHALADESLTGFARWYTRLHIAGCRKCRSALEAVEALRERLRDLRRQGETLTPSALSPERRHALDAALTEVEKRVPEK